MLFKFVILVFSLVAVGSCQSLVPSLTHDKVIRPEIEPLASWRGQVFTKAENISDENCPDLGDISLEIISDGDNSCKKAPCEIKGQISWKFFGEREEQTLLTGNVDQHGNFQFAGISDDIVSDSAGQFGDDSVSATISGVSDCFSHYTLVKIST